MSVTTAPPDPAGSESVAASADLVRALLEQHRSARLDQVQGGAFADPTISDLEVRERSLQAARQALRQIDAALARLDAGTYGRCTGCAGSIADERLAALPYVEVCVSCAAG